MSLLKYLWPRNQPVNLLLVDDNEINFDPVLSERQLIHQADFLSFVSSGVINARYRGRVPELPHGPSIDGGNVYIKFRPEPEKTRWANTWRNGIPEDSVRIGGGYLLFNTEHVTDAGRFGGLLAHELGHMLGMAHNAADSIMSNQPYLPYEYQSLYRLYDYNNLYAIFLRRMLEMPTGFGFGEEDPNKCIISIPRIYVGEGKYKSVYLHGEKEGGSWSLWTNALNSTDVSPGQCLSYISDNKLHFPLRFMGQSFNVTADIIQTNSLTEFVNVKILS